ncbi:hypothetical protein IFM89_037838 [Coptis chinensis]|uniref:Protein kinase domain-containing protein n=1 Tax=Coptis chinensis TaxID=261450 RepID=A0A835HSR3_9MAGN|nr:hypothetical protein IFM89_037838 [Coptis chinensis]
MDLPSTPMALSTPFFIASPNNNNNKKTKNKSSKQMLSSRSAGGVIGNDNIITVHTYHLHPTTTIHALGGVAPAPSHIKAHTPIISPTGAVVLQGNNHRRLITILSVSAAAGLFIILLSVLFIMGFFKFLRFHNRRRSKRVEDAELPPLNTSNIAQRASSDLSICPPKKNVHPPKEFSWEEIVRLSRNFSTVIGQGGFSTIYLASFSDSSLGALKIHQHSERLDRIFKQELEILLRVRHENIVQLLGYCDEAADDGGSALVFEYLPNGNLQEKLQGIGNGGLPWKSRAWIAFQLARAIDYLHDKCTLPIIHGDIKTSNVLLDDQLNCKLCDFGFAKMGFSATVLPSSSLTLMGSPGYIDPHYLRTGIASKKNDVYSFGVILLELITGIEAFCSEKEQLLTTLVGPLLRGDKVDLQPLMAWGQDLSNSDLEEVMDVVSIAARCLMQQPSLRPSMADILATMRHKLSSISSYVASA